MIKMGDIVILKDDKFKVLYKVMSKDTAGLFHIVPIRQPDHGGYRRSKWLYVRYMRHAEPEELL